MGIAIFDTAGANTWTCPAGVTMVTVRVWGGGGGGGTGLPAASGGGGGGGGGFSQSAYTVTPTTVYDLEVGAGGASDNSGSDSHFDNSVIAAGGSTGGSPSAGTGGQAASGSGDITFSGGDGGTGTNADPGGGGGGGEVSGTGGNGGNGANASGATGGAGGNLQYGTDFGDGGAGGDDGAGGSIGHSPGGGGGGGGVDAPGGAGFDGMVEISWQDSPFGGPVGGLLVGEADEMLDLGDRPVSSTIYFKFPTKGTSGAPITLAGTPLVRVYKDDGTTEDDSGITLTVDFDSRTGMHQVKIDLSTDTTFYAAGSDYDVVLTAGTVDGISVAGHVLAHFTLEKQSWILALLETGVTFKQALRAIAAVLVGERADAGAGTATFKAIGNEGTTRVTCGTASGGNRDNFTLNL